MLDKRLVCLGSGISGEAWVYQRRFGSSGLYVVKSYHGKEPYESKQDFNRRCSHEYDVLSRLNHPSIIRVNGTGTTWTGMLFCTMEFGGMLTFREILRNQLPFKEIICLFKQVVSGVAYLHSQRICHRDLKLQNLVISADGYVKIIDFCDSADLSGTDTCHGIIGSEKYSAPEVFTQLSYSGYKIDVWAMGILFFYMISRRHPWKIAKEQDPDFSAFLRGEARITADFPKEMGLFCGQLLRVNPTKRVKIDVIEIDPFLAGRQSCTNSARCGIDHGRLHQRPV